MTDPRGTLTSSDSQGSGNMPLPQDGRGDGRSKAKQQLRRPMPATQERLLNGTQPGNGTSQSPSKKQTTLSASAPEFVPKFTAPPPPSSQSGQGDQNYKANLSVTAAEFVPRSHGAAYSQKNLFEDFQRLVSITPSHVSTPMTKPTADKVINDFKTILFNMTIQPGNIEEYLSSMVNSLKNVTDDQIVKDIIEVLFEQCVTEPNFHYTGARVCKHLAKELVQVKVFSNFRSQFLTRCKEDYLKKDDWVYNEETIPRMCGFTMFIGELFLNFEVEKPDGTLEKIGILRFVLRDLLLALLSHPTDTTVKCVTQLLKLTGATIEETSHLNNKPEERDYSKVFETLKELENSPGLNKTSNILIKAVLNLKNSNWGRPDVPPTPPSDSTSQRMYPPQNFVQTEDQKNSLKTEEQRNPLKNEPVFYNHQGQPISREEAGYFDPDFSDYNLEQAAAAYACMQENDSFQRDMQMFPNEMSNYQQEYGGNIPAYPPDMQFPGEYQSWSNNPEDATYDEEVYRAYEEFENYGDNYMDEEMEEAYEAFLRSQSQGHH